MPLESIHLASEEGFSTVIAYRKRYPMSDSPLVSVIVPVYKVEGFIRRTISSILKQDYLNLEVILVDDGSPDGCPAILDEFAASDGRIKVIHQENNGVALARNAGLAASNGDYIMFVDGDDWVEKDYVSYFLSLFEESRCDVAVNLSIIGGNDKSEAGSCTVCAEKAIEWIYMSLLHEAVWNKMYRAVTIKDHGLRFDPEIWYGEGMLFNIELLQYVDEVVVGCKPVYHQVFNPDSAMRSFNLESNMCGLRSLDIQKSKWVKISHEIDAAWTYHRYCFNRSIAGGLVRAGIVDRHRELYNECVNNLRKQLFVPMRANISLNAKIKWVFWIIAPGLTARIAAMRFKRRAAFRK